jgi:hypothetical protein
MPKRSEDVLTSTDQELTLDDLVKIQSSLEDAEKPVPEPLLQEVVS